MTEAEASAAPVHARDRGAEGAGRRGRLEHARPRAGRTGVHHRLGLAQPRPLRHRPRRIVAFLTPKWERDSTTRCARTSGASTPDRIAVRFQYESHDRDGQWWRSYGNELWEFDEYGLMRRREASINDLQIDESERRIFGPRPDEDVYGNPRFVNPLRRPPRHAAALLLQRVAGVLFRYKESVLALLVGFVLLLRRSRPWNGVGFGAAIAWEIITVLDRLWWSKRQAPQVGTNTLLGLGAVVVQPCTPWGEGEAWGRDMASTIRGSCQDRVRVCSVEGLTLHVEPE